MKAIRLVGDKTFKEYWILEDSANAIKIKNASDQKDLVVIDAATVTDASGVKLASHGIRHSRGGADPLDYSLIMKTLLKSVTPSLGTGGALGSAVSISPDSGYSRIDVKGIKITVGGTLATEETITVRITFNWDDGSTTYIDKSFTATGDYFLAEADFQALWKNLVGLTGIIVQASSSATSTSATVTVVVRGMQY